MRSNVVPIVFIISQLLVLNSFAIDFKSFRPLPELKDLTCSNYFRHNDESNADEQLKQRVKEYSRNRIKYQDPEKWDAIKMDCDSIFNRTYFQFQDLYPEEREFPIAYTRVLFKDYMLVERELGATYAPQNFYCYIIDKNSPEVFHQRVHSLSKCFPNVFIMEQNFEMDSHGKNMGFAQHECLKALTKPEYNWKYMFLLQNHELALKTNQEMIQMFKWYNGTNDIKAVKVQAEQELATSDDWSFEALNLFKNSTRNSQPHKGYKPVLRFTKSTTHVSLSRAMADFLFNEMDLSTLMHRIEQSGKYVDAQNMFKDELLMGTLNSEDAINVPGGFTRHCLEQNIGTRGLTALVFWGGYKGGCKSGIWRHSVCMLAMENLDQLTTSKYFLANKFMPNLDYGAIGCWHERMFNRTHLARGTDTLRPEYYLNMKQVRFNRERNEQGDRFNASAFDCTK